LRNLRSVDIELHPGINLFLGKNGAGKTSVLESIVVLAKGRSFRAGQTSSLIGPEDELFRVVARTGHAGSAEQVLGIERTRTDWRARRNGNEVKQLGELAVHLPLVLIEPNSHQLVSGPPEARRRYLDWGVFHVEHDFLLRWRRYARAMKQRNAALRNRQDAVARSMEGMLSELGEGIHSDRDRQVSRVCESVHQALAELSPGLRDVSIRYQKGWSGDSLESALRSAYRKDAERGATGPGPHRAELQIQQEGKSARERLSRGEQKILAAALLIGQARLIAEAGEKPLLLLDDLASEFDGEHLAAVLNTGLSLGSQLWITGTSLGPYSDLRAEPHAMFHVEQGIIST